ncbi:PLP-dependent aminotransferase family protein [Trinickia dinghuensis]|uniref:PLP-dependent aminotransferase family protein n=1 Tax=Trinickia dinghuensis TaxID=2291023 RepID=A0A3D8JXD4_9BURK|nr:PLP-dependent aminotransferase family protein [Trinickia dinghuensis]RDU97530.1 PLP-dependent aminotransferase family protein [Trinickia dinghuensis]
MPDLDESAGPVLDLLLETPLVRDRNGASLQRQLHQRIRGAILDGRFPSGCRLPGSRALAAALGISRNSVTTVYELLGTEGYIALSRQGTRVSTLERPAGRPRAARQTAAPAIAQRAARVSDSTLNAGDNLALRPGVPALARFPLGAWKNCLDRAVRGAGTSGLWYGNPQGEPALRTAIMRHLAVARGVRCEPEQIVITEGAQEALTLCVRLVTNPGDTAWVEDPGYRGAKTAMLCGDLDVIPMRVDENGLAIPESAWTTQTPRLVYTSPSHQYPTGAVLTAARRLDLIGKAQQHGAWIIEDDYDSEYRHSGELVGAMQGLLPHAPVFYVGTFSKTLFPSLRLGFLVLPEALAAKAAPLLKETLRGGHRYEQLALAEFIESGQFTRHLGRMRRLYKRRQDALRAALKQYLDVPHTVDGGDSGMHLTIRLPGDCSDVRIAEAARAFEMAPMPLSRFAMHPLPEDNGLVLGYGNTSESLFVPLIQRLAKLVEADRQAKAERTTSA